jgi:hypothetical protein
VKQAKQEDYYMSHDINVIIDDILIGFSSFDYDGCIVVEFYDVPSKKFIYRETTDGYYSFGPTSPDAIDIKYIKELRKKKIKHGVLGDDWKEGHWDAEIIEEEQEKAK